VCNSGPRVSHRLPEALIAGRPRTRDSEPPLISGEVDVSGDSGRNMKETGTSNFQSRYYRNGEPKSDPRPSLAGYNAAHSSSYTGPADTHPPQESPAIRSVHQYTSPKSDSVDWSGKNGQNKSMPSNSSRIDKQAYLNKAEGSPPLARLNSMGYENGSRRDSADHFTTKNSPDLLQTSPLRKPTPTPRFSELGFVSS